MPPASIVVVFIPQDMGTIAIVQGLDEGAANVIVATVSKHIAEGDSCAAGVLCRAEKAYIDELSSSNTTSGTAKRTSFASVLAFVAGTILCIVSNAL